MYFALLYSVVEVIQDVTKIVFYQQEEERQEAMTAKLNAVLKAVRLSALIPSHCPACTSAKNFLCAGHSTQQELKHKDEMHRLLRTISHEIRNPLHGILGNTQALLDLLLPVQQHAMQAVNASSGACNASISNSNSSGVNAGDVYTDGAPHSASTPLADADGLRVVKRRSISALRFLSKASRYCTSGSDRQLLGRPQSLLQAGSYSSNSSAHTMPQSAFVSAASGTGVGRASSTSSSEAAPAGCSALKTATSMVSEIHECALHQASIINVSAQIAFGLCRLYKQNRCSLL
jgi:His Kinase A (phospho-acceptor) domain